MANLKAVAAAKVQTVIPRMSKETGMRVLSLASNLGPLVAVNSGCPSPKLHPAEELNRVSDILTVKSYLDRPTRACWKAMKIKAEGILAKDNTYLDEFTFRFNRRTSRSRGKLFYRLLEQAVAVEPAPYKSLVK